MFWVSENMTFLNGSWNYISTSFGEII